MKKLDIRWPIGFLFVILGLLLCAFGAASNPGLYQKSLGVNVNLYWGAVLFGFGLLCLFLGRKAPQNQGRS